MKSTALVRKVAAVAGTTVLAGLVAGLASTPAQATAKPRAKVSVSTPQASVGDYRGACPVDVTFSATVKLKIKGTTQVRYRWLHGDGSKSKIKTVKVSANGTKRIRLAETATFNGDTKGWQALQVLSPRKVTSKKGHFSVDCKPTKKHRHHHQRVSAKAWVSPAKYVGSCTRVALEGRISVNRPAWVRYRWVVNGKAIDHGRVRVHDSRKVGVTFAPRHSHRGSAVLEVLSPRRAVSNTAYYKVGCKDHSHAPSHRSKVEVFGLSARTDRDSCTVNARARVSTSGADRVRWVWSVNGRTVDSGSTTFNRGGGSQFVSLNTALSGAAKNGGTIRLTAYGTKDSASESRSFAACKPSNHLPKFPKDTPTESPKFPKFPKEKRDTPRDTPTESPTPAPSPEVETPKTEQPA